MTSRAMKHWEELQNGGSGTWLYSRKVGPLCWVFIGIDDVVDSCGKDAMSYFSANVGVVDMLQVDPETIAASLRGAGADHWLPELTLEQKLPATAQCMFEHGSYAPAWEGSSPLINKEKKKNWQWDVPSENSSTFIRLRAAARRFAESALLDEEQRNEFLNGRIVNALGQNAFEYANGTAGLWAVLRRIKDNPEASDVDKVILHMYQAAGQTLGAGPVPDDIMGGRKDA